MTEQGARGRSREMQRFSYYLRYGRILPEHVEAECKFNPYRADDGRYDFAPGKGTLPPRNRSSDRNAMTAPVHREMAAAGPSYRGPVRGPAPQQASQPRRVDHSWLSTRTETSGNRDPGLISSGRGDRGGQSYGPHQLASKTGTVAEFVASPEARRWASEFHNLSPETVAFNQRWKQIAARDSTAFRDAQDAYTARIFYDEPVRKIANSTGLNIEARSEAVRQVVYATSINQGQFGAPRMIADAIRQTDTKHSRTSVSYDLALIGAIYDVRTTFWLNKSNRERARAAASRTQGASDLWNKPLVSVETWR
jgi:hypothetical protein